MKNEIFTLDGKTFLASKVQSVGVIRKYIAPRKHLSQEVIDKIGINRSSEECYAVKVDCGEFSEYLTGRSEAKVKTLIDMLWSKVDEYITYQADLLDSLSVNSRGHTTDRSFLR